jgi:hypothetical protein
MADIVKNSKYLLYTQWESKFHTGSIISGSLMHLIHVDSEEEAKVELQRIKTNSAAFDAKFPSSSEGRKTSYVYIRNRPEWWSRP